MSGDLTVRRTQTASGGTAVQVVRYKGKRRIVIKHIGSAHSEEELGRLLTQAALYIEQHCAQPSLFASSLTTVGAVDLEHATLLSVTHAYARNALLGCARHCGLGRVPEMFLDLALMRIIEPASKLRTIELLQQYFGVDYAQRTVYRQLPKLLSYQAAIEESAIETARNHFGELFNLVLYDVTTLYFESFKEYDLQRPGFSKDNKPQQPQIVIGLITTRSGFPVMHEVFEGNTFEGHTMLEILKRFQKRVGDNCKPVIVADAAMLSRQNMQKLQEQGYRYIVGARLANTSRQFIEQVHSELPRTDGAIKRFHYNYAKQSVAVICEFSSVRYKKDKREFEKQINRALGLIERSEPGRRAKFVKKAGVHNQFELDAELKVKAEKLLGIKGYVTNIPAQELSDNDVITYYHDLWHVEQAFRMSKSDLRARPIFHHAQENIKAHVLLCFMALMIGKFLEIKTAMPLRQVRDQLWRVHEALIRDERTGKTHLITMKNTQSQNKTLWDLINTFSTH